MLKTLPNLQLFFLLVFLASLILILDNFKVFSLLKVTAGFVTNPISFSLYSTKQNLSSQLSFVWEARSAAQQNKALQEQIATLLSENASLKTQISESRAQLTQNQHLDPKTYNTVATRPIGLDRYLRVDKGEQDGIKIGQAVIVNNNLIGQIAALNAKSATVKRLIDPDSKVASFSFGKEGKAKGILIGQFGTDMLLDKILHEEHIQKDDLVYSEGTEGFWPRGLILGKVSEVIETPNEIFKQAKVAPVFNINDLDLVFIIVD